MAAILLSPTIINGQSRKYMKDMKRYNDRSLNSNNESKLVIENCVLFGSVRPHIDPFEIVCIAGVFLWTGCQDREYSFVKVFFFFLFCILKFVFLSRKYYFQIHLKNRMG